MFNLNDFCDVCAALLTNAEIEAGERGRNQRDQLNLLTPGRTQ